MLGKVRTIDRRMFVRRCVACGYDGALLRGGQATRCARCGCDLHSRPARSYAEMEGLVGEPVTLDTPLHAPERSQHLAHRWLAFLVLVLAIMTVVGWLSAAALAAA